jgi:hypothetical protein
VDLPFGQWIDALRAGIGLVPPPLIAIVLLGGPTAVWLLYHFVVQPRTARIARLRAYERTAYWVCANCRSVNDYRLVRCYRCEAEPVEEDLEVINAYPSGPRPLTPVGPGLNLGATAPATRPAPILTIEAASAVMGPVQPWDSGPEALDEEGEGEDRATLPDVAAMTEVIEAPRRRRAARQPGPIRVAPARPAVARPRRVAVAGTTRDADDDPPAA